MLKEKFFIILQYILPQHLLSRMMGVLTNTQVKWLKNFLIRRFIQRYQVNMQEAIYPSPEDYVSFNDFFTRKLKKNTRTIDPNADTIICPVDGAISQIGAIKNNTLIQAKGFTFSLDSLLGHQKNVSEHFENGLFATLYLSPRDYHCIHMPFTGKLTQTIYIPGNLFSVNATTVNHVPALFARNERLVCLFETSFGKMAVILVGAFFVASIHTVFAGKVSPSHHKSIIVTDYQDENYELNKGDLLGHFELGSTVIVLLPNRVTAFEKTFESLKTIQLGIPMANC